MSITFWCPEEEESVREEFDCYCQVQSPDSTPLKGCPHCQGTGTHVFMSRPHEFNMANGTAYGLLELAGLPQDYSGSVAGSALYTTLGRVAAARNTATSEYWERRLGSLEKLLVVAKELDSKVVWA